MAILKARFSSYPYSGLLSFCFSHPSTSLFRIAVLSCFEAFPRRHMLWLLKVKSRGHVYPLS